MSLPPVPQVWSVASLLLAVSDALAARFSACAVQGELSGFTRAASGHCYFTLKDGDGEAASLRCAMFRRAASLLDFSPRDGQQVELRGRIAVYEPRGEMQFVVESMRAVGAGSLYEQFLRLKAKLQAEGLFDAGRKKPLPRHPARVGVLTSLAGAALHDVLTTIARRAPHVAVVVYPSLVQGADAPEAILAALAAVDTRREVDILIVARGGGSIEDLWAFNDERVVRTVANLSVPTIAGVGHETDVTLVDFAADLRAATPTAAAELAAPARDELLAQLDGLAQLVARRVRQRLDREAQRLDQRALQLARPTAWIHRAATRLQSADVRLRQALHSGLSRASQASLRMADRWRHAGTIRRLQAQSRLETLAMRLASLDPLRVLARGYTLVLDDEGRALMSARATRPGQTVAIRWTDATLPARLDPAVGGDREGE
ncbi:MAG: exodeoxyribonuclease VII large subunit [Aquincola sp.]|nr:exodeoxyribonuclease VII large subunit [Aquincola sp.]MDH5329433.1 exodeoxyribonuclease VII large subunit [Aquincola sp.]